MKTYGIKTKGGKGSMYSVQGEYMSRDGITLAVLDKMRVPVFVVPVADLVFAAELTVPAEQDITANEAT